MGLKVGTVKVEKYNPIWKEMFEQEKVNLEKVFKKVAVEIEHIIHVMEVDSKRYQDTIIFRNYLRNNQDVLKEYEDLKNKLAEKYADDRKMYTASKNEFIQKVINTAYTKGEDRR